MPTERKDVPRATRETVLMEAGYRCANPTCYHVIALELHHMIAVADEGGNEPENLVALCPYCHALFHKGEIAHKAIRFWKERIVNLNKTIGDEFFPKQKGEALEKKLSDVALTAGYGLEFQVGEFVRRVCKIGFTHVHDGKDLFVTIGYGTFIQTRTVLTAGSVIDTMKNVLSRRVGKPTVWTGTGVVDCELKNRHKWRDHAVLRIGQGNEEPRSEDRPSFFKELTSIETPPRMRYKAFVGEQVGFFNDPSNHARFRSPFDYQLEIAHVAFRLRIENGRDLEFSLSPVMSRIEYLGAGVFTRAGELVGVIKDLLIADDEAGRRPVITSFVGIKDVEFPWPQPL